jgi:Family of unknown function (DUF6492)
MTLDGVLPLTLKDADRARILVESLRAFFPELSTLWVVVPDVDVAAVANRLGGPPVRVLPETQVLPELPFYRKAFRASIAFRRRPQGWYIQQLAKMSGPDFVQSEFYMTFDADVFCTRPLAASDLVRDGRAVCQRSRDDVHADWYAWAERVLGLRRSGFRHGVTPLLYSREGMRGLQRCLETRVNPLIRLAGGGGWRGLLLRQTPWAEHTLYYTFLEATGQFDRFHCALTGRALYDKSVWQEGEFETWRPADAFGPDGPWFCLVQSWLGIPPSAVWKRVGPHLMAAGARPLEW